MHALQHRYVNSLHTEWAFLPSREELSSAFWTQPIIQPVLLLGKSLILVIPVIPCFLSHAFTLFFSVFFFLTWFSFIDNILALHILSSDWFFFFLTLFSSHLFIPPSSFQSPHMSGLFQSYNTSVFWSSSDFCVLCSRGEQNFTRLVMFWIFSAATNYLLLEQKENISLDFEVAAL